MLPILSTPFVQIALPIVITILIASWNSNRRIDDLARNMNGRFTSIDARLLAIETRLGEVERKVEVLQVKAWR